MSTRRRLAIAAVTLVVLVAVALALPFLVPLDSYRPQVEQQVQAVLKQPVAIQGLRAHLLPRPHVSLRGVAIGAAGEIRVDGIAVTPDLFSLFGSDKVIHSVEVDGPVLNQKGINILAAAAQVKSEHPVRLENLRLSKAVLDFGKARFGPFDARVQLDAQSQPVEALVTTADGKLKATVTPAPAQNGKPGGWLIDASASKWTPPMGPAIAFDELSLKGSATAAGANFNAVTAKLYGGTVTGKAAAAWAKGLQVNGDFTVSQVEVEHIAAALSPKTHVSGRLTAHPVLSAQAANADQLLPALHVETPFNVQNGVLYGFDIEKAATNLIKRGSDGGETRFEQLSGHMVMAGGAYRFSDLKIASGVLAADGNVAISAKKELSGRIDAQVKALGVSTGVPLTVAGNLDLPLLYPTGATIAGAVAGTAVMGPGLGTSVGAKLGGWAQNLLGGKK